MAQVSGELNLPTGQQQRGVGVLPSFSHTRTTAAACLALTLHT